MTEIELTAIKLRAYNGHLTENDVRELFRFIEQQAQTIEAMKPVVTAAEEFCQTVVYVQSQYAEDGSAYVRTSMDAVSKLRYFVEKWEQQVKEESNDVRA